MKTLLSVALLAAFVAAPLAAATLRVDDKGTDDKKPKPYAVGSVVDETLSFKDIEGNAHSMKDYRGKVVFVHFHSMKCPYMGPAEPKLIQMVKDYAKKDVVFLGINSNQAELGKKPSESMEDVPYADLKEHVKENGVNFAIVPDHGAELADKFGGKTTPHCYVIDAKGVIQYIGALDDDPKGSKEKPVNYVSLAIDSLLAGKKVETATTKPYGCSIKR